MLNLFKKALSLLQQTKNGRSCFVAFTILHLISMNHTDTPNAFDLLAQAKANMELAWLSKEQVRQHFCELFDKATAGDYENLVLLCAEWLDMEIIKDDLETN